jgi:sRNA-binding regulator protein Hfq
MSSQTILTGAVRGNGSAGRLAPADGKPFPASKKKSPALFPVRLTAHNVEEFPAQRHAELFYLQKQIQLQTPMAIVLDDGEKVEGCIEWYDLHCLKVRGRTKTLVYKSAIKYMYKQGDTGQ